MAACKEVVTLTKPSVSQSSMLPSEPVPTEDSKAAENDKPRKSLTLSNTLNSKAVLNTWKEIRSDVLKIRPKDTRLIHDPLDHLAFHVNRREYSKALQRRAVSGRYTPRPAALVRSAKSNRLTRTLVYPTIDDALILTTLGRAILPALTSGAPPWVSYGGKGAGSWRSEQYEDWFLQFLRHRSRTDRIVENADDLIIATDIANFFPSVNLDLLRNRIASKIELHDHGINLLFRLLRDLGSSGMYDPFALHGLPQEPDNNSRMLASFFLSEVDDHFHDLGTSDRYSRFVDDMVFSASDQLEASRLIARLQHSLGESGLSVNASKTRIHYKDAFRDDLFPEENEYLNTLEGPQIINLVRPGFDKKCKAFAALDPYGKWPQVMRRYYSVARKLGTRVLVPVAWKHMRLYPELAPSALDYLQVAQPSEAMVRRLTDLIKTDGSLFEDMQILAYETLLHVPLPNRLSMRRDIVANAFNHIRGIDGFVMPTGYIESLCSLVIYKFGEPSDIDQLAEMAKRDDLAIESARQLYVILRSEERYDMISNGLPHRFDDPDLWRMVALFKHVEDNPMRVLREGSSWFDAKGSIEPKRNIFRIRTLPVLSMLTRNAESRAHAVILVRRTMDQLSTSATSRLVDRVALFRLRELISNSELN